MSGVAIFLVFFISALINGYQRNPSPEPNKSQEQVMNVDKTNELKDQK